MKKNRITLNIFIVIAAAVYAVIMILGNVQTVRVGLAVVEGSYAEEYAEENKLETATISDSEQKYFDLRYEAEIEEESEEVTEEETDGEEELDYLSFSLESIPFEYNESADSIEITKYRADKELDIMPEGMVVIPSYVNGKPVTTVSMDMVGKFTVVVIPETVTEITGQTKAHIYSEMFVLETACTVLAFLVALVAVNIILPRYKKSEEYFLSGSQMILTILYVIVQMVFGILTIFEVVALNTYIALIISALLLLGYLGIVLTANKGRTHSKEVTEKIAVKTEWMKEFKRSTASLAQEVKDANARKAVERLVEEIKFSDPMSSPSVEKANEKMEAAVNELKNAIAGGITEEILEKCKTAMKAVQERNSVCKANK